MGHGGRGHQLDAGRGRGRARPDFHDGAILVAAYRAAASVAVRQEACNVGGPALGVRHVLKGLEAGHQAEGSAWALAVVGMERVIGDRRLESGRP